MSLKALRDIDPVGVTRYSFWYEGRHGEKRYFASKPTDSI